MRQARRVSFAAPFVMIVSAAACGGSPRHEPIHDNPARPMPPEKPPADPPGDGKGPMTAEQCQAIQRDTPCEAGQSCHIREGCGLEGYECRDGMWHAMMMFCNPPPPKQ